MGARGNSGVILSQILRGLADTFRAARRGVGGRRRRRAAPRRRRRLRGGAAPGRGHDPHRRARRRPRRSSARSTRARPRSSACSSGPRPRRATAVAQHARPAAGAARGRRGRRRRARASTLLLDACLEVVDGRPIPEPEVGAHAGRGRRARRRGDGDDVADLRYEVMYFLDAPTTRRSPRSRTAWGALGDSIVVVGGDGLWNCHVHTDDIGAAIEAGIDAGRPRKIRVTDLLEQVGGGSAGCARPSAVAAERRTRRARSTTAVVAVAVGDGVRRLLAQPRRAAGRRRRPVDEPVDRADPRSGRARARPTRVIVLPNNKNIVAGGASRSTRSPSKPVAVVPTAAVVEALAALRRLRPGRRRSTTTRRRCTRPRRACAPARSRRRCATASAECGPIAEGDWIAITRDGICVADDVGRPTRRARCSTSSSTTTARSSPCIVGADAPTPTTPRASASTSRSRIPHVEVEFHDGGQPLYPYLVGVE